MNLLQMLTNFQQFTKSFQGDPKAEVEKLVQSGQISQEQVNQAQAMAKELQSLFK